MLDLGCWAAMPEVNAGWALGLAGTGGGERQSCRELGGGGGMH